MIVGARADKSKLYQSKQRILRKQYCQPNVKADVDTLFQACLDYIITNEEMTMDDGEWIDTFHTIVPAGCCNFILIDGRWENFFIQAGLKYPQIARVYKQANIDVFFSDLKKFQLGHA